MHIVSHRQTCYREKWWRSPVLPPRFSLPKRSKDYHSNFGLETGGFSPGVANSPPLLKPRHNTLHCTPVTDQYNSPRIYCLFYTLVWQVLISTELLFVKAQYIQFFKQRFWLGMVTVKKNRSLCFLQDLWNFLRGGVHSSIPYYNPIINMRLSKCKIQWF